MSDEEPASDLTKAPFYWPVRPESAAGNPVSEEVDREFEAADGQSPVAAVASNTSDLQAAEPEQTATVEDLDGELKRQSRSRWGNALLALAFFVALFSGCGLMGANSAYQNDLDDARDVERGMMNDGVSASDARALAPFPEEPETGGAIGGLVGAAALAGVAVALKVSASPQTDAERARRKASAQETWKAVAVVADAAQHGGANSNLVCPHCGEKGTVHRKKSERKQGISGGKATGAVMTGGASLFLTGLSRKQEGAEMWCSNCHTSWFVS